MKRVPRFRKGWNRAYYNAVRAYGESEGLDSFQQVFELMKARLGRKGTVGFYHYLYNTRRPDGDARFLIADFLRRDPRQLWPVNREEA